VETLFERDENGFGSKTRSSLKVEISIGGSKIELLEQ